MQNADHLPQMIQIRNVPDDVHRTLKVRVAKAGMSLSDYRLSSLIGGKEPLAAPHLVDAEVANALRRLNLIGLLSTPLALAALDDFRDLALERYAHERVLERAFALRHNASIYDALYLALAEALSARFGTMDRALALVPNVDAEVEVIA